MIELVLVYCLITDAHVCVEKTLPMEGFGSPVACVSDAQQKAQEFLRDHPKYKLSTWRCEVDVPKQAPA